MLALSSAARPLLLFVSNAIASSQFQCLFISSVSLFHVLSFHQLSSSAAGPRRLLPGALLWAGICGGAQLGISVVNGWRASAAAEVSERRWLWASLTTEQRAAFAALVAATSGLHEPGTSADGRALNVIHVDNPSEPPPPRFGAALRAFAANNGLAAASSAEPVSAETVAAASAAGGRSLLPGQALAQSQSKAQAQAQAQARPWYAWMPVQFGAAAGDEARLVKLHARLREVEELLGEREPRVDEDVKAFLAQQRDQGQAAGAAHAAPRSLA